MFFAGVPLRGFVGAHASSAAISTTACRRMVAGSICHGRGRCIFVPCPKRLVALPCVRASHQATQATGVKIWQQRWGGRCTVDARRQVRLPRQTGGQRREGGGVASADLDGSMPPLLHAAEQSCTRQPTRSLARE